MKKILVTIVALLLALAPIASLASETEAVQYEKTEYHLVFIPKLVHEWYEDVKAGIDMAVAELAEQGITVTYAWEPPTDAIVTDQIAKIESAVATSPDAISIAVIDASATNAVINELVASGVKMATFDCDAPDSDRYYYCGHAGNYEDGFYMGEVLAEALDYTGEVAILAGTLSAGNHQERVAGFKAAIAQYPDMTIVAEQADEDSVETALAVMEGWISAFPDLKGVIGVNAASPIGAARAITDADLVGEILIVGMAENLEAMEYVKSGTILCTLRQQVPTYGYNSVYNMLLIADGKEPSVVVDEIPATYVTIDNVDQFLED